MSLLLRNRLRVVLCREQLALSMQARGWRQGASDTMFVPCVVGADGPDWQPALASLDAWLGQNKVAARAEVILSDSLVRYAVMPWSADVSAGEERRAMTRIHFEAMFGPMLGEWEFQVAPAGYRQARVACAVDSRLSSALHALFAVHKMRMVSLRPYLMCVINHWHAQLSGDALLVVVAPDHCMMAGFKAGAWHSVRRIRLGDASGARLQQLIQRERVLQGLDGASVYLHAPGQEMSAAMPGDDATVLAVAANDAPVVAAMMATCGHAP